MSNPEFLDVDAIAPKVKKTISIKGKTHDFVAPSVGDFLDEMRRVREMQKRLKDSEETDQFEAMELMIESMKNSIKSSFPTVSDDELNALSSEQVYAIRNFISAQIEEDSSEAEDASGNG